MSTHVAQIINGLKHSIENTLNKVAMVDCLLTAVKESVDSYFTEDKVTLKFNYYEPITEDNNYDNKSLVVEWLVPHKFQHIETKGFKGSLDKIRLEFDLSIIPQFFHEGMTSPKTLITLKSIKCIDIDFRLLEGEASIDTHYKADKKEIENSLSKHEYKYLLDKQVINNIAKVIRKYVNDKDIYVTSYEPEFII